MKPLYIFDIDGTITDAEHRRHYVTGPKKDFDSFYAACYYDTPIEPVIHTMMTLRTSGADIKFFSGRRESCREDTIKWFKAYTNMHNPNLTLRPNGDYTKDSTLKESWYEALSTEDKLRLIATFDDRNQVVDMWRSHNIQCFQCAPGDF